MDYRRVTITHNNKKKTYTFPIFCKAIEKFNKVGFRKNKVLKTECRDVELTIAELLMETPHKNLVKIYKVDREQKTILMERLKLNKEDYYPKMPKKHQIKIYLKHIKSALEHLKSLGIVYVDLKGLNTGYCSKNKQWKLFDFNCSNFYDNNNEWVFKKRIPIFIKSYVKNLKPNEIDDFIFKYFKKSLKKAISSGCDYEAELEGYDYTDLMD